MQIMDYLDHLCKLPLLKGLSRDVVIELAHQLEVFQFAEGATIFRQDDPGDAMFIIHSGRAKVVRTTLNDQELILHEFGPGEFFGEMSLIDETPRSASAVALTPMVVFELDRGDFQSVLMRHPHVILEITRNLSAKLRYAATYIQKAITWNQQIAAGDYNTVMHQLQTNNAHPHGPHGTDEAEINLLISTFFQMINDVRQREEKLKDEVHQLRIEIDQVRRTQQLAEITETDYFQQLQQQAKRLRSQP
ncbi:MAG: cyclic nucleotide-binding domain-containing protein [Caldilineaceae bacterium]